MDKEPVLDVPAPLYDLPGFHEPFSALSHLAGALIFLVLGYFLLLRGRRHPSGMIYLAIYAFSVVFLLSMSGVFHMLVRGSPAHRVLERLDHGAIFVLIAGTFTPAHGILFRGWQRWAPLVLIWSIAAAGITLKTIFFDDLAHWVGLALYLIMGWLGAFGGVLLARRHGYNFVKPLLFGGIAYSVGAIVDVLEWMVAIPGIIHPHELFHMAVLMGAFWHWLFIWQFAAGMGHRDRTLPVDKTVAHAADLA